MEYHPMGTSRLWRREPTGKMCVKNFGGGNANGPNVDWDVTRRCSSTNLTIHDISHVQSSWILNLGSVGLFYSSHAPLAERGIWGMNG